MAPRQDRTNFHDQVERQIKEIISRLHQLMVQVTAYDTAGRPSRDVLSAELKSLSTALASLTMSVNEYQVAYRAHPLGALPQVPIDLIQYVESSRNPDIYTREFVEQTRRWNQIMRGKMNSFSLFADVLAEQITAAMPELREDVIKVMDKSQR